MATDEGRTFGQGTVAENYARHLQPYLFDPWARRLVAFAGLPAGSTVLDVAAGTGAVSLVAAAAVGPSGRVIASDISMAMLAGIGARAGAAVDGTALPASAPIELLECSAESIPLPDASVDAVLCQQGFPFIPDRVAAAREMRRVLRPGGQVVIAVWASGAPVEPLDGFSRAMGPHIPPSRLSGPVGDSSLSMSASDVAAALTAGGLDRVTATVETLTVQWPTPESEADGVAGSPYGPRYAALDDQIRAEVRAQLVAGFTAPGGGTFAHVTSAVFGCGYAG